jgi:argininosuccinate lyase
MAAMTTSRKPWEHAKSGGSEHDELAARFVESLSYDTRLYKHDIVGSIAHARMLCHVKLITEEDLAAIEKGLSEIQDEIEAAGVTGWGGWQIELEDVHMCIEAALIEKIGEPGKKLHTGRSRNDQVATDLLLWIRDETDQVIDQLTGLIGAFVDAAEAQGEIVMPSYTHLQRAQPIALGGELLAWAEPFARGIDRLVALRTGDRCPLGSGAIAGSSLPLDRRQTAEQLMDDAVPDDITGAFADMFGLSEEEMASVDNATSITRSSIDATASRDVALDFVYALSMTAMWLSRWAEQWIIYMTSEFGFLTIGDAYTTGSSMMPQKRNPDMLELIRGRCGNVYGHLMALLTICKGLTVGYNRDLQEDKRHVFAAYDTVKDCLDMATRIVKSAKFDETRIAASLDRGFLDATSLAEYLVTRGVAFRSAHQVVGALVHHCLEQGITQLSELSVDQMKQIGGCDAVEEGVYEWLGAANVVERYQTYGNAGLSGYRQQLAEWKDRLGAGDGQAGN